MGANQAMVNAPSSVRSSSSSMASYGSYANNLYTIVAGRSTAVSVNNASSKGSVYTAITQYTQGVSDGLHNSTASIDDVLNNDVSLSRDIGVRIGLLAVPFSFVGSFTTGAGEVKTGIKTLEYGVPLAKTVGPKIFSSTRAARTYLRKIGYDVPSNVQLHHIVEQHADNIAKFGAEAIHNSENLVPILKSTHTEINKVFNSGIPNFSKFRYYVKDLDFQSQFNIGKNILKGVLE